MAGRLEVITGPMFSGKSEELIRRLTRAKIAGKSVIAYHPAIDKRYGFGVIASHSGSKIESTGILDASTMLVDYKKYNVIGIDEAQFFTDMVTIVIDEMIHNGKTVIVAGLDMTYRQEPFGEMPILMAKADRVDKISAVCAVCGNDGMLTQRLVDGSPAPFSGETIQVGGLDTYEARCRGCFEANV